MHAVQQGQKKCLRGEKMHPGHSATGDSGVSGTWLAGGERGGSTHPYRMLSHERAMSGMGTFFCPHSGLHRACCSQPPSIIVCTTMDSDCHIRHGAVLLTTAPMTACTTMGPGYHIMGHHACR